MHISDTQNCGRGLLTLTVKLVNRYIPHAKCSYVYRLQTDLSRNTYHRETPKTPHDKQKGLLRRHSCVLVNIIVMDAACYHLPWNELATISHTQNQLCVTQGFARVHISDTQNCGRGLLTLTVKLVNRYIPHAKCSYVYRLQTDLSRNTYHRETPKTPHDKQKGLLRRHSCVLVNIIVMDAACYHLPKNELSVAQGKASERISDTQQPR